jgi:hypothetical protein
MISTQPQEGETQSSSEVCAKKNDSPPKRPNKWRGIGLLRMHKTSGKKRREKGLQK